MARPRKKTRRQPNGQPYRPPDRVHEETAAVRRRELSSIGVPPEQWGNALAGFTLGQLRLRGRACETDPISISESQFQAGETWTRIVHRHGQIMGYEVRRNVKSPGFVMVGGVSCAPDASDEDVANIRDKYRLCYGALAEASRMHGFQVTKATWGACLETWPLPSVGPHIGSVRIGLNALARVLK